AGARSAGRYRPAPPAAAAGRRRPGRAAGWTARTLAAPAPSRAPLRLVHCYRRPLAVACHHAGRGVAATMGTGHAAACARRRGRHARRGSHRAGGTGTPASAGTAVGADVMRGVERARWAAYLGMGLALLLGLAWLG